MQMVASEQWIGLRRLLNDRTPADRHLYVASSRSCADDIAQDLQASLDGTTKVLLVGPTGGGKSSELRAVGRAIGETRVQVDIDLDRCGITASNVTALDLMYMAGLGLLRHVRDTSRKDLFKALSEAYADDDDDAGSLGQVADALQGLAGFADAAAAVAVGVDLAAGGAPVASASMSVLSAGLRLFHRFGATVSESSPKGRMIQDAVAAIHEAARQASGGRRFVLLIDGLEKMNGQSAERFRQVFEHTRLLLDLPCDAIIAAPACTLSQTTSATQMGWKTKVVWGFVVDTHGLVDLLERRFAQAGLPAADHAAPRVLDGLAQASGGIPRLAVAMTNRAVELARRAGVSVVSVEQSQQAIDEQAEDLHLGLTDESMVLLARVNGQSRLPEGAATLFADGRILCLPPREAGRGPRFVVHPLIAPGLVPSNTRSDDKPT